MTTTPTTSTTGPGITPEAPGPGGPAEQSASARKIREIWASVRKPLFSVALTLVLGFGVVLLVSDQPLHAYEQLFVANFSTPANFGNLLMRSAPLLLIALGIVFSFRAGVFNVGGEGQLYVGAVSAAATGLALPGLPGPLLIVTCMAAGIVAGALLAWIPAVLKVTWGVDEVVITLMLNFIAILFTSYLVANPLRDPEAYGATSRMLPEQSWLPAIPGLPTGNIGFVIALLLVPAAWLLLFRTVWGADLRAAGTNLRFAETVGVRGRREIILSMLLSGALAGLAGAVYVLGTGHRFEQNFSPEFGLIALTVALLARLHPVGVLLTSLFYAAMLNGAAYMQIATNVPRSLVSLLTGLLVLLMTVEVRRRRRRGRSKEVSA
ncbi:ABC transporter permease [Streptomyces sp. NBC_01754]|uniref:ABC transporter permease n=1 Tax=Streptomyces sp. NBC_01754 TaxID=2975930 RepID=UPI002DD8507E|nr:ABC transporter permease [Streptomyces sp. NBC_01754]WSC95846.1 ABC transporter permease [Streptomyces sp. NBC_01754]